ncbi:hypothetical protein CRYUN_Cryun05aG0206500 [Craigia yunnanensis]
MEELRTGKNDAVNDTDDDDPPALSSHALAALKEVLEEQSESLANRETVETGGGTAAESEVALVTEDWRLSQFCSTLEPQDNSQLGWLDLAPKIDPNISVQLLEYDKRFEQYGSDFTFYDYNQPENVLLELKHTYQVVVADPPYLSKECLEKVTHSFLVRPQQSYLLLLTGDVQRDRTAELWGLHPCNFRPRHSRKLGHEFRLFTN